MRTVQPNWRPLEIRGLELWFSPAELRFLDILARRTQSTPGAIAEALLTEAEPEIVTQAVEAAPRDPASALDALRLAAFYLECAEARVPDPVVMPAALRDYIADRLWAISLCDFQWDASGGKPLSSRADPAQAFNLPKGHRKSDEEKELFLREFGEMVETWRLGLQERQDKNSALRKPQGSLTPHELALRFVGQGFGRQQRSAETALARHRVEPEEE